MLEVHHVGVLAEEFAGVNTKDRREEFYQSHIGEEDLPDLGAGLIYGRDGGKLSSVFFPTLISSVRMPGSRKVISVIGFPPSSL